MTVTQVQLEATFAETWAAIAKGRDMANEVAAEDGSVEARRVVKRHVSA